MPIYEYQCKKCGEVFEAFQKISDKPLSKCKMCNGKVERLISQSSFQLKGSGWYLTDYSRKSHSGSSTSPSCAKSTAKPDKGSSDTGTSAPKADAPKK